MIYQHTLSTCTISLIGNQSRHDFLLPAATQAPVRRCHLKVASDVTQPGFQTIVPWQITNENGPLAADGVLMTTPDTATIFHTADCPAVIIEHTPSRTIITLHAGRPAMTPQRGENIITKALQLLQKRNARPADLQVYLTGGISGQHFPHDHPDSEAKAIPFLDTYGPTVFTDVDRLSLDLVQVIKQQLSTAGVPVTHITHDGHCTYENPELTSHRRDGATRTTTNTILVISHQ
jgi:copper oxidase (laccase) domain-containing protein